MDRKERADLDRYLTRDDDNRSIRQEEEDDMEHSICEVCGNHVGEVDVTNNNAMRFRKEDATDYSYCHVSCLVEAVKVMATVSDLEQMKHLIDLKNP